MPGSPKRVLPSISITGTGSISLRPKLRKDQQQKNTALGGSMAGEVVLDAFASQSDPTKDAGWYIISGSVEVAVLYLYTKAMC
ncbi:MAG: hypothetical protein ACPGZU_17385, partial [Ketobacter sp.]